MDLLIINKLGKDEKAEDYKWSDYEVREEFFPSCQYIQNLSEEFENNDIEDFLEKMEKTGCTVDYDKKTFIIPDRNEVTDRILETWMNTPKLNEELDLCDRSASGFLGLLSSLKYWIEYEDALPAVVDGVGYNTIVQALENMDKDVEYTVCQALMMKA